MKIYIIESSEYKYNASSIFAYIPEGNYHTSDQNYFGDLFYPRLRNWPHLVTYWRVATCSDSDRFFTVTEATITKDQFNQILKLQNVINACEAIQKQHSNVDNPITWNRRRGKAYEEWKQRDDDNFNASLEVSNYNSPYYLAARAASKELRDLLINIRDSK